MNVLNIGLVSTDMLYFAVGYFKLDGGAMFTASHNPKEWNGVKFCKENAKPFGEAEGMFTLKEIIEKGDFLESDVKGYLEEKDIYKDFADYVLRFIDIKALKPLKVIIDAGNGMAGKMIPEVFKSLPFQVTPMYFEIDGSFPNHEPNPAEEDNLKNLKEKVIKKKADLGLAFDGDADRVIFVDEKGEQISPSLIAALIADYILGKNPKEIIVYDVRSDKIIPVVLNKHKAIGIRSKVGHANIKEVMRENNAAFGCELSGHYYYRDNFYADSGIITSLLVLHLLSKDGRKISRLVNSYRVFYESGEINTKFARAEELIRKMKDRYKKGKQDFLDGLTCDFGDWWFNLRTSNTEPAIRLNVKAKNKELLKEKTLELLKFIRT